MKPIQDLSFVDITQKQITINFFSDFSKSKLTATQWRPHFACSFSSASYPSASSWTASSPPSPWTTPGQSWTPSSSPGGEVHPLAFDASLTSSELANLFQRDPEWKRPWSPQQHPEGTEDWAVGWAGLEHQTYSNMFHVEKKSVHLGCYMLSLLYCCC